MSIFKFVSGASLFPDHAIVDFKNIHNLNVESYVLFGGNFWDFKPPRHHLE